MANDNIIKKGKIENKIYDIMSSEEYRNHKDVYDPQFTAIEKDGTIYPVRPKNDNRPGYYPKGTFNFYKDPNNEEQKNYDSNNLIDFSNSNNIKDVIEKATSLKNMESEVLTTPDNIFKPSIKEEDDPEMKLIKQAVIAKNMDIDKYKGRFGRNFPNDKREFNKNNMTLAKIKRFANAFDWKVTMIIEDKDENVPNPMGKKFMAEINSGKTTDVGDEDE